MTSKRDKVLFITDSIGRNVEEATNTLIYTEVAYGAAYKSDALKPNDNFVYVAQNAPQKRQYKYAILQGASSDITDLVIPDSSPATTQYLKQEVFINSQNMIIAAKTITDNNPSIEQVIILDRTPRFDIDSADPSGLKRELSMYGNKVFRDELDKTDMKDKIIVASHNLPSEPSKAIYGDPDVHGYDGIHLYGKDGRKYYTHSLCRILQEVYTRSSRSFHNHSLPNVFQGVNASSVPQNSSTPSHHPPLPSQGSHVRYPKVSVIQMAAQGSRSGLPDYLASIPNHVQPDHLQHQYSIPVSNKFQHLGNC